MSGIGWNHRYAIVRYLCSSLWAVPLFALVVEQIGVRFLTFIDQSLRWVPALTLTAAEAGDALASIESLTIAFLVFMFGSALVALQVESAQLTPRIVATTVLRDNTIRFTVAVGTKARLHDPLHTLDRLHLLPEDLMLARSTDRQGVGGSPTNYMNLHEPQQSCRASVQGD